MVVETIFKAKGCLRRIELMCQSCSEPEKFPLACTISRPSVEGSLQAGAIAPAEFFLLAWQYPSAFLDWSELGNCCV